LAVWDKSTDPNKQSDELVGYCKVGLQSGFTTLGQMTPERVADLIHKNGEKLIEIVNQQVPIRGIALNDERGLLNVSVSVGSLKQIKATADDDYYSSGRPFRHQQVTRQKTFDSREEEEVNETASDHNLDDFALSSDESELQQNEIKKKLKEKKENLKKLQKEQRKQFKDEHEDEEDEEEEEEDADFQQPAKKKPRDAVMPDKQKPKGGYSNKEDQNQLPQKKQSKISSNKSISNRDDLHDPYGHKHPPQLPSPKDGSSKKLPTEPSEPIGRRPIRPNLPDNPRSKKDIPEEPSVNSVKLVLKENDKDIVRDPVTGMSFQRLPSGGFIELKKVTVATDDGKKESFFINPNVDPALTRRNQISQKELQGLKAIEAVVNPIANALPTSSDRQNENSVHDLELINRLSQQYLKTLQSLGSKKSHRSNRRRDFDYMNEDSEASEEYSEDSEDKGMEWHLINKNKQPPTDRGSSSNRIPHSKGSLSRIKDKEDSNIQGITGTKNPDPHWQGKLL
jgi:hypothetical protein